MFLLVFGCEYAVMMVLPFFGLADSRWVALVDSGILSLLVVPCLFLLGLLKHRDNYRNYSTSEVSDKSRWGRIFGLRNQYVAVLVLLSVGPLLWLGRTITHEVGESLRDDADADARSRLDHDELLLQRYVDQIRRDALGVTAFPPVRGLLRSRRAGGIDPFDGSSTTADWTTRLQSLLTSFLDAHPDAFKVRYIDAEGQEWMKLDARSGIATFALGADLEDKSDRYYFRNSINLPEGQCYISQLDLNVEHGVVETPHRPVLRVAAPIWFEGRSQGVAVISYSPEPLLDSLRWAGQSHLILASRSGVYLYHEDASKRWSDQLGTDANLFNDWPTIKRPIASGLQQLTDGDRSIYLKRVSLGDADGDRWWLLGTQWDDALLFRMSRKLEATTSSVSFGVAIMALAIALVMASAWGRPIAHLVDASRAFGDGETGVRVASHRADEIGDLARAFNAMAETIEQNTERLEANVLERTLELTNLKAAMDEHAIISITDIMGNITYANGKFCEISGYERSELYGNNHRMIKSEEHPPEFFRDLWLTISSGKTWHGEIKNRAKDGSFYWVDATIVPFKDTQGKIIQYVAIRTDISTVKFAEKRLEQANAEIEARTEELEAQHQELVHLNIYLDEAQAKAVMATKAKSDFLANMSHEIRTPMTAILGFSENLRDGDLSKSETLDAIDTIHNNGEYLLGLINDILDVSKIEAGKMQIEHIPCSPCQVVADVVSLMKVRSEAKKLTLDWEYIGPIPETIQSDPTRLKQVLINIIGNAVKFTEEGGVRLVTRFLPDDTAPTIQFDVLDTGVGMTVEQAANLFHPFTQADNTMSRKFGGTGLGLAISKAFAEMLGGDIEIVDSKPGCGTRFRITIGTGSLEGVRMLDNPIQAIGVMEETPVERSATSQGTKSLDCRILLAEDGPDNQRLIAFVLKKAGADVVVVENGQLAVDAVQAEQEAGKLFDVILMDMQMPVLDGYGATMKLRDAGYTGPIIALTAHAMAADREKCLNSGCDDYATKPIDRKKLIETIRTHLKPATMPSSVT